MLTGSRSHMSIGGRQKTPPTSLGCLPRMRQDGQRQTSPSYLRCSAEAVEASVSVTQNVVPSKAYAAPVDAGTRASIMWQLLPRACRCATVEHLSVSRSDMARSYSRAL